jgi:formiminoglutamase
MYFNREAESLSSILVNLDEMNQDFSQIIAHIHASSCDLGVIRNMGRSGARFAPQAIISQLKKLSLISPEDQKITYKNSLDGKQLSDYQNDKFFNQFQSEQKKEISNSLKKLSKIPKFIQVGGGHDHIFPLVSAIKESYDLKATPLVIINLDAHLDTRQDTSFHSGTPFRQIDQILNSNEQLYLYQYGIHYSNNSLSTREPLENIQQSIISYHEDNFCSARDLIEIIKKKSSFNLEDSIILLSVDCDAFTPEYFEGVSAINGRGLPAQILFDIINSINQIKARLHVLGIYEYNPVYDNLSCKGARLLGQSIFNFVYNF